MSLSEGLKQHAVSFAELLRATGDCNGAVDGELADNGGKAEELIVDFTAPSGSLDEDFPGTEIFRSPGGGRLSFILVADTGIVVVEDVEAGIFLLPVVEIETFAGLATFAELVCCPGLVLLLSRAGKSSSCRVDDCEDMAAACEAEFAPGAFASDLDFP